MKHLKLFEKFNLPYSMLKVGDVYITDKAWISDNALDEDDRIKLRNKRIEFLNAGGNNNSLNYQYKRIMPEVKLIEIDMDKKEKLKILAFFIDDEKEYVFNISKSNLLRKATSEETERFNLIQNRKKYNL